MAAKGGFVDVVEVILKKQSNVNLVDQVIFHQRYVSCKVLQYFSAVKKLLELRLKGFLFPSVLEGLRGDLMDKNFIAFF